MDLGQRYTEAIRAVYFDYELEMKLTRFYEDIKFPIVTVLSRVSVQKDDNPFLTIGFIVPMDYGDLFFEAEIIYETPEDVLVLDIRKISSDKFLDYINKNQYINYELHL